jgi:hypothetical protein
VESTDAAALIQAVDEVLRRDAGALTSVRAALVAKRDAAVSSELYEIAMRIHEELGGLEWLVAPVRLFRPDEQLTACADGMQVSLRFRSGRLRTWEQSPSTSVSAAPTTEWNDTLTRNATLAAKLATRPVI